MFANVSRSRLLPMSLPFRYFGAAAGFQVAAWATLFFFPYEVVQFEGGLGPVFAALHLLTLGVLAMTAVGATLQLLPVATRQPVRALWAVRLVWWMLVAGSAVFTLGAALYRPDVMGPGAMTVIGALALYAVLLFRNLCGARGMPVVVAHGWAALACLAGLGVTGLALVARYEHGIALDYTAVRSAHLVLAAYGFMGLLALGLSNFLLPMLAVAPPPHPRSAVAVLSIALVALALGVTGMTTLAAAIGLSAALLHVCILERSLRRTLRPPLGPSFLLVRVSWGCLLGSLALAALGFPGGATLFAVLLVPGWLLTFLLGVLSRIVPFLGSVHASTGSRGTPLISALTPTGLLACQRALHLAALAGLAAAPILGEVWLARAGAAAGLAGALAFASFYLFVVMKVRRHALQPPHQPAPA